MRHLLFISNFLLLLGCSSPYKSLQHVEGDVFAIEKFKPNFRTELYRTSVDIIGKHLSGLLLIKTMQDSSTRIVFTSEIGVKYFDFEFALDGKFSVNYIVEKMNRKTVLTTLRKDFQLILMLNLDFEKAYLLKDDQFIYYVFPKENDLRYYILKAETQKLERMESGTTSKIKVRAIMQNYLENVPDTISIDHYNYNFTIGLKRLIR